MAASATRAHALREARRPEAEKAAELADLFCRMGRRRVRRLFAELWSNDDVRKYTLAQRVLAGKHAWIERGILGLDATARELRPATVLGKAPDHAPVDRPVGTH
jgi:hypothetical protein